MALAARAAKVSGTRLGCAATRARAPAARAACLRVSAKWVLQPTGTGDCSHLDRPVPLPSPVVLSEEKLIIGREASGSVTLALPVPTVSGTHAMIDLVAGQYYVTDLASTNGTFLDGEELVAGTPAPLLAGSELVIGDEFLCKFKLEFLP